MGAAILIGLGLTLVLLSYLALRLAKDAPDRAELARLRADAENQRRTVEELRVRAALVDGLQELGTVTYFLTFGRPVVACLVPRISRVVVPGLMHHVTQRGNNRQDVFLTDADREAYLQILRLQAAKCRLGVLAYCLMTNHVHLVVVPQDETSMARAIGRTHFTYAQRFNTDHGRSGHLWQGRFYSCAMESGHELAALRYVEQNPVRAGLVGEAWRYPWSSAAAHTGGADPSGVLHLKSWQRLTRGMDWRAFLFERAADEESSNLRHQTMTGRPLGSDHFLAVTGRQLNRELRSKPAGRPAKK